jgi:hypothetical protein
MGRRAKAEEQRRDCDCLKQSSHDGRLTQMLSQRQLPITHNVSEECAAASTVSLCSHYLLQREGVPALCARPLVREESAAGAPGRGANSIL